MQTSWLHCLKIARLSSYAVKRVQGNVTTKISLFGNKQNLRNQLGHRHGAKVVAQLSHCGRQVIVGHTGFDEAVSASTVRDPVMGARPRALRIDELPMDGVPWRFGYE